MGSYMNPLTGSGWSDQPPQNQILSGANPIQLPSMGGSPNLSFNRPSDPNTINRDLAWTNVLAGRMKDMLAPQFAQLMGQYGGDAGKIFEQFANLGSPFYKQKQAEAFTQGVGQNQNAAAMAKQQLGAQGYGYGPSGANAAMIGGMNMQGSQNLAEQYLQQLFQNEQLQMGGAQGLSSLAGLFNPTQLLGGTAVGSNLQQPTPWENAIGLLGSLSGAGAKGVSL